MVPWQSTRDLLSGLQRLTVRVSVKQILVYFATICRKLSGLMRLDTYIFLTLNANQMTLEAIVSWPLGYRS